MPQFNTIKFVTINGEEYREQVVKEGDRLFKKFKNKNITYKVLEELIEQDYSNHYYWESVFDYIENVK